MNPSRLNEAFGKVSQHLQPVLLLAMRLFWGWQFAVAGFGKLTNLGRTASFFESLHIPLPMVNAALAAATEFGGGILLMAGLLSRLISVPLAFTMVIAYVTAEKEALGALFSEPDKFVSAAPFLFLLTSLVVLAFGPGALSLDRLWLKQKV